ncbi:hypothetical protein FB451DRAFT_1195518 [Mycena latifolia]|nr:hypothetical protein FB451DRAFT_1195518 [Mycena latifolia]
MLASLGLVALLGLRHRPHILPGRIFKLIQLERMQSLHNPGGFYFWLWRFKCWTQVSTCRSTAKIPQTNDAALELGFYDVPSTIVMAQYGWDSEPAFCWLLRGAPVFVRRVFCATRRSPRCALS